MNPTATSGLRRKRGARTRTRPGITCVVRVRARYVLPCRTNRSRGSPHPDRPLPARPLGFPTRAARAAGTGRGGRQRRNGAAWSATPTWRCDRLVRSVAAGQAPPARNRPVDRARLDHFSRLPRPNHFQSPFRSSPVALRAYAYAPIGGTWLGASRLWSYHAFMPVIRPHLARCFDQDD